MDHRPTGRKFATPMKHDTSQMLGRISKHPLRMILTIRATVTNRASARDEARVKRGVAVIRKWRNGYKRPNPERDKIVRREREKKQRIRNKALFKELKRTLSCKKCGESHPATLEFHHRDPREKSLEVSIMVFKETWKRVLREIAKCDVYCANCHRKEHWTEG